jgi:putative ABC transport system permease protein
MLSNFLKIAFRTVRRNKLFTGLNIFSLATGLASAILIFLWVADELSYDRFTSNHDKIFRLTAQIKTTAAASVPAAFGRIGDAIPSIKRVTRIQTDQKIVTAANRKFDEKRIVYADTNFLRTFHYPLLQGDPSTALAAPNSVVLTEATAIRYFGSVARAMGNSIFIDNDSATARVTAVLKDIPANSHLQFDLLFPIRDMDAQTDPSHGWRFFDSYVYYELADPLRPNPSTLDQIQQQLNAMRSKAIIGTLAVPAAFSLQPLTDIHLRSNFTVDLPGMGNIQYVRIFVLIALFILIIACINFMNLATAATAARAKEVGLRKTIGALRRQLIAQFIGESMLLAFLSLILALGLVYLAIPFFNNIAAKSIRFNLLDPRLFGAVVTITTIVGLLAGSYPAFYLSSIKTVRVLKGDPFQPGHNSPLRNGLIVLQFAVSVILIIGTVIISRQLNYLHNRDIGFDRNNLLYIPLPTIGDRREVARTLRYIFSQSPETSDFTLIGDLPTNMAGSRPLSWPGMDKNTTVLCHYLNVDGHTSTTFGMKMAAGRFYPPDFQGNDSIYDYVINETAARMIGKTPESAIGSQIFVRGLAGAVIGVVKDFNFQSVHQAVEPLVMRAWPAGYYAVLRLPPGRLHETIASVQHGFEKAFGDTPFSYGFIDQDIDSLYITESRMQTLFGFFATLSVLISCLGLFGLAAFTTRRRTKEIGMRKVLGASEYQIVLLLTKKFLQLVAISLVLAFPLAWYLMTLWLQGFIYRVGIDIWIFAGSGALAMLIACSTVCFTTIRAALANPIQTLRSE